MNYILHNYILQIGYQLGEFSFLFEALRYVGRIEIDQRNSIKLSITCIFRT